MIKDLKENIGKWSFDKKYLGDVIITGKKMLENDKLSRRMRQSIKIDIETFQNYILDDYEMKNLTSYNVCTPKNIDRLVEFILLKMKKQYDVLGRDFIIWILNLTDSLMFETDYDCVNKTTKLTTLELVDLTIKNYENNMPKYLDLTKKIVLDDTVKQINFYNSEESYCHYDSITNKSYIVINTKGPLCILNHEVQHAIEDKLMYPTSRFYFELGPIFSEMLFNEELYKKNGYLESGDVNFRIDEADYLLDELFSYFNILLFLASKNFNVATNEFLNLFANYMELDSVLLIEYLREEIASVSMEENMTYLFSFLKAIELRELAINSKEDAFFIFEHYLRNKKFVFHKPKDDFKIYSRYMDEVKCKVRKK